MSRSGTMDASSASFCQCRPSLACFRGDVHGGVPCETLTDNEMMMGPAAAGTNGLASPDSLCPFGIEACCAVSTLRLATRRAPTAPGAPAVITKPTATVDAGHDAP